MEEKILKTMTNYYHSEDKALEWYNRPNLYFQLWKIDKATPKQMVEAGEGEQVLHWIRVCIGDKNV